MKYGLGIGKRSLHYYDPFFYKLPHCISIIDETPLGLAIKSQFYGEHYFTQMQAYAITVA